MCGSIVTDQGIGPCAHQEQMNGSYELPTSVFQLVNIYSIMFPSDQLIRHINESIFSIISDFWRF